MEKVFGKNRKLKKMCLDKISINIYIHYKFYLRLFTSIYVYTIL